ncbi:hypothetical protein Syn8016DRAFT_1673 [Synechococcus sp. WH 8016]|nr:hypothetical protein Syn8016DRAFT_1673 [Synechococcus sp. WH 8016]
MNNKATDLYKRAQVQPLFIPLFLPSSVLEESQPPWPSIIICADSRVAPELFSILRLVICLSCAAQVTHFLMRDLSRPSLTVLSKKFP